MHKEQVWDKNIFKSMAALTIEIEIAKQLNFNKIIDFFIRKKDKKSYNCSVVELTSVAFSCVTSHYNLNDRL